MIITAEQIKMFIQTAANEYGGAAADALGTNGTGWQGNNANMTMSMVKGIADTINKAATSTSIDYHILGSPITHGLGKLPIVQIYDATGRLFPNAQFTVTTETITILSGPPTGTVVYI